MLKLKWFWTIALLILILGGFFRFHALGLKAMHHDEGVNHTFASQLNERFYYHYNPHHYHGPFLYYATMPWWHTMGVTKVSLRFSSALAGMLAILFFLLMHKSIGRPGALFAAAVVAISPVDVYFSRTFIHEIFLASFATGLLWTVLEFERTAKMRYFLAFCAFFSLCFTVKETSAIMTLSLVTAYIGTALYKKLMAKRYADTLEPFTIDFGAIWKNKLFAADGIAIGLTIWILFFASFLTNPRGLIDFFVAFLPWMSTGFAEQKGHFKPASYFFVVLGKYYLPIIVPMILGAFWGLSKGKMKFVFLFLYGFATIFIYSIIPYKTPWCIMHIAVPFIALAGYAVSRAIEAQNAPKYWGFHVAAVLALGLAVYSYYSYKINFLEYDDDKYKIVYVQTDRSYEDAFELLDRMATRSKQGKELDIVRIGTKNPIGFYLRDYTKTKRYETPPKTPLNQPVVLVNSELADETKTLLFGEHVELTYPIWPGTYMVMLVERDFYDKYAKDTQ